jgi:hypothetical protein
LGKPPLIPKPADVSAERPELCVDRLVHHGPLWRNG